MIPFNWLKCFIRICQEFYRFAESDILQQIQQCIQGLYRGYTGAIQGLYRGCKGAIQGLYRGYTGAIQGDFNDDLKLNKYDETKI